MRDSNRARHDTHKAWFIISIVRGRVVKQENATTSCRLIIARNTRSPCGSPRSYLAQLTNGKSGLNGVAPFSHVIIQQQRRLLRTCRSQRMLGIPSHVNQWRRERYRTPDCGNRLRAVSRLSPTSRTLILSAPRSSSSHRGWREKIILAFWIFNARSKIDGNSSQHVRETNEHRNLVAYSLISDNESDSRSIPPTCPAVRSLIPLTLTIAIRLFSAGTGWSLI